MVMSVSKLMLLMCCVSDHSLSVLAALVWDCKHGQKTAVSCSITYSTVIIGRSIHLSGSGVAGEGILCTLFL